MKKSHIFKLSKTALGGVLALFSFTAMAQSTGSVSYDLFPEQSSSLQCEVQGEFVMNFTWEGESSIAQSIVWDNSGASAASGSAHLSIFHNGLEIWAGYPEEVSSHLHAFVLTEVVFEKDESYSLSFDLSQVEVSVYQQNTFPWRPSSSGPIEINTTQLTGAVDQPIDPDLIFPYFTINLVYGVSVSEAVLDSWNPYPNPCKSVINLPSFPENASATLIDVNGSVVKESNLTSERASLNVSDLSQGTYILKVDIESGQTIYRRIAIL